MGLDRSRRTSGAGKHLAQCARATRHPPHWPASALPSPLVTHAQFPLRGRLAVHPSKQWRAKAAPPPRRPGRRSRAPGRSAPSGWRESPWHARRGRHEPAALFPAPAGAAPRRRHPLARRRARQPFVPHRGAQPAQRQLRCAVNQVTWSGASSTSQRSVRNQGDTIDLLQGGFARAAPCPARCRAGSGCRCGAPPRGCRRIGWRAMMSSRISSFRCRISPMARRPLKPVPRQCPQPRPARKRMPAPARRVMPESASSAASGSIVDRAVRAAHPHQPLRHDAVQGGDEAVGIDPHVDEAADDVEHVVGVHGGEHQVAGQRRLHGDLRGLRIADLADHDLVRVVAQDGAQAAREGQALLLVDRDLQHAGQLVFDRILDGDDLVLAVVDLGDRGVQRGGLAASRWGR